MMTTLSFAGGTLVLPETVFEGRLTVVGETIDGVEEGAQPLEGDVDLGSDLLLPGLVELHTDHLEKHLMPRHRVHWPAYSALQSFDSQLAAVGITTVFDALAIGDTLGKKDLQSLLEEAVEVITQAGQSGHLRAEHLLHLRLEVSNPEIMALYEAFADHPLVRLLSLMDHTPGDRQYADVDRFKEALQSSGEMTAQELETYVAERQEESATFAGGHRQELAKAGLAAGKIVASHDDACQAHIEEAVALGVSISEFPTTLEAAQAAKAAGLDVIMGAPNVIRGGSHSGNVAARDLAASGLLDALSSDYMPAGLILAPFRLVEELGMDLASAIRLVTLNPARMVGLEDRGSLEVGKRADLVRVSLSAAGPIVREVYRSGRRVA